MRSACTLLFCLCLGIISPTAALALNVYQYSPPQHTSIEVGDQVTFNIGADDPQGLSFAEWYLGSSFQAHHGMSGNYDEDSWSHTFPTSGTYYVYAYVYNVNDDQDFVWWQITVEEPPNDPPSITRLSPTSTYISVTLGDNQSFSARATDSDCDLDYFEWYLDGSFQVNHNASGCSDDDTWSHTFNSVGTFDVFVYVYDDNGADDYTWWQVTVEEPPNDPPSITRLSPTSTYITVTLGDNQSFSARATDSDCDLDFFEWYLDSSFQVNHDASGCSSDDNWSHTFDMVGTFDVFVYVYDDDAADDHTWWQVTVEAPSPTPPELTRVYPTEPTISVEEGSGQYFEISIEDSGCDLAFSEWYIDDQFIAHHPGISGCTAMDCWSPSFVDGSQHTVKAIVYDGADDFANLSWTVEMVMPASEPEFFDDFVYDDRDDSFLNGFGWHLVDGETSPGIGVYIRENIDIGGSCGDRQLLLSSNVDQDSITSSRIETSEDLFFEGTYAALVSFDNRPQDNDDLIVETFYTIKYLPEDEDYSECDFEYLPYDGWNPSGVGGAGNSMHLVTWAELGNRAIDDQLLTLNGWHLLHMEILDGETVRYYIDGTVYAEHSFSDPQGDPVYPNVPMNISLANWIAELTQTQIADPYQMRVDWVYHAKNARLDYPEILDRVTELRSGGTTRRNTMDLETSSVDGWSLEVVPGGMVARPNPLVDATCITYDLPLSSAIEISVFDVQGRLIRSLSRGTQFRGAYNVTWDGKSNDGSRVSSGTYICRLASGERSWDIRLVVVR